jgi:FAD-dependent oxidoreductase family protein
MGLVHNEVELSMLRAVRGVFDPDGLFNPGKVVPDPVTESPGAVGEIPFGRRGT